MVVCDSVINCCFYNIRASKLRKKALLLSVFTVAYNILEGIISIMLGIASAEIRGNWE